MTIYVQIFHAAAMFGNQPQPHFPHKHKQYVFISPPLHLLVINQVLHPTQLTPMPLHPTLARLLFHLAS